MERSPASGRLDWGLLVLIAVASYGFSAFLPGQPTVTNLILCSAILAILVIWNLDYAFTAVPASPLVFLLAFWFIFAALFSPEIVRSLLRAGVLVLMIIYVYTRQSTAEQTLQVIALATTIALIPSIVGLIIPLGVPTRGHAGSSGGYAGYFPWNSTAGLCASAALLSIALLVLKTGFKWWQLPATVGALLMLVLSKSATAAVACGSAAIVLVGLEVVRRIGVRIGPLVGAAGFGIVGGLLAAKASDLMAEVTEITGRTDSATGRTVFWQYALDGISESPLWGYGGGYWESYRINTAHNGFLDVALSAGVPAVLVLSAIVLIAGLRLAVAASPMLPLLVFGVVANFAISHLTAPTVTSLAVWLAIGAAARTGMEQDSNDLGVFVAGKPRSPTAMRPLPGSLAEP